MPDKIETPDLEILRPESETDELSRLLAWILDDLIPIPGTKVRIGLDPILGFLPGVGDGSTAFFSSVLLLRALKARMPRIVMVRMAFNILLNSVVGAIPFVGDLFSAAFKSNRRNYDLLQRHAGSARESTHGDWIFVLSLLGLILAVTIACSLVAAWLFFKIVSFVMGI